MAKLAKRHRDFSMDVFYEGLDSKGQQMRVTFEMQIDGGKQIYQCEMFTDKAERKRMANELKAVITSLEDTI